MKCGRQGCPNIFKGSKAMASVYDELRAATEKTYKGPHLENWCAECYATLEANKYTYVMIRPKPGDIRANTKRVPRVGKPGEVIEEAVVDLADSSPIDEAVPAWAKRAEVIDAAGIEVKSKKPKPNKKQQAASESPIESGT